MCIDLDWPAQAFRADKGAFAGQWPEELTHTTQTTHYYLESPDMVNKWGPINTGMHFCKAQKQKAVFVFHPTLTCVVTG